MKRSAALALAMMFMAWQAHAEAVLRPMPRPAAGVADIAFAPANDLRPLARPVQLAAAMPRLGAEPQEDTAKQGPFLPLPTVMLGDLVEPTPVTDLPLLAVPAPLANGELHLASMAAKPDYVSPLAVSVSSAPFEGPAVVTASSAGAIAPGLVRPMMRPVMRPLGPAGQTGPAAALLTVGPAAKLVQVAPPFVPPALAGIRPIRRPAALIEAVVRVPAAGLTSAIRPAARPAIVKKRAKGPEPEAEVIQAAVVVPNPGKAGVTGKKGAVCGDRAIKGQTIPPILSRVKGCGVADPVRITSVAGVSLSTPADIDCNTANALKDWVENGLQPQFGKNPVVQLQVAGSYACRPRNNVKGNKISEHGKGHAIDIAGFVLSDGTVLTVARDWGSKGAGRLIRAAQKAGCGIFNTTLGPGSDGYHEDHLHFDTASGRGPYCH